MAIVRTAKGTTSGKSLSFIQITNITLQNGASLIVGIGHNGSSAVSTVSWNGQSLTNEQTARGFGDGIWAIHNVTGATGTLTIAGPTASWSVWAIELTGLDTSASPKDKSTSGSGSGTSPSSGNTATTAQADEILIGHIETRGFLDDAAGSWSNSFNNGQRAGTSGSLASTNSTSSEGYLVVSATGQYAAAKTGITSRSWWAAIVTYKAAASGQQNRGEGFFAAI